MCVCTYVRTKHLSVSNLLQLMFAQTQLQLGSKLQTYILTHLKSPPLVQHT